MDSTHDQEQKYVAFLRGINVGGHHKVPMSELCAALVDMGFSEITTLLNSGNAVFKTEPIKEIELENAISKHLEQTFGFPIPTLVRKIEAIKHLVSSNPFKYIEMHKDLRLYISFLRSAPREDQDLPWISPDGTFRIPAVLHNTVATVVDLSSTKTIEAMKVLERKFTKDITTRNWNTLQKIAALEQ